MERCCNNFFSSCSINHTTLLKVISTCFTGTITTGGRIGERRSISGTRLNMGSPGGFMPGGGGVASFKTSMESLKPTDKGLSSVSKQSLLDMVSSRINVHRNKAPQVTIQGLKLS